MATNETRQFNQEKQVAKNSVKFAAKGAKKAGKAAGKTGKKVWRVLPLKVKLIIAGILALIILTVMVQGTSSSSFSRTYRVNAVYEDNRYNIPKTDEEANASMHNEDVAREDTIKLVDVIHEAKERAMSDKDALVEDAIETKAAQLQKSGITIDMELTKQHMKTEAADASGYVYAQGSMVGSNGLGGNTIAETAVKLAWPEGTNPKKYMIYKGGQATEAFKKAQKTWHPNTGDASFACCCHAARVVVEEATGKKIDGTLLPNTDSKSEAKQLLKAAVKDTNLEIIEWDGKKSSLKRGDVCTTALPASSGGGGHVFIWLGEGSKVANGHRAESNRSFLLIEDVASLWMSRNVSRYSYWYILRLPETAAGNYPSLNPEDFVSGEPMTAEAMRGESGLHGQRAGDQGGGEVATTSMGSNWTNIIRPKSPAMALRIASAAEQAAKNNHIGYDQDTPDRKTAINEAKKVGYNIPAITTNCELTCGELANLAWAAAGVPEEYTPLRGCTATYNLWDTVKGSGLFELMDFSKSKVLPGDVVFRDGEHTGVVISSPNKINGVGSVFSKKDELTVLSEINTSTGRRHSIGYVDETEANCAQSFALVGDKFAVAYVQTNHAPGYVQLVDKNGTKKGNVRCDDILHANAACATHDGKFMVAGRLGGNRGAANVFSLDGDSVTSDGEKSIPASASSIAYDRQTDTYCLKVGMKVHLYDRNFNKKSTVSCIYHGDGTFYQDIGAGAGYIFCCFTGYGSADSETSGKNFIDVYSETTGDYCGTYNVNYGELESCDVVDDELVLLVHISGYINYIHYTGIKVNDNLAGFGNQTAISVLDMDILAAYNLSISNTDMFLNAKEAKNEGSEDGWRNDDAYRDISGKKLPIYWFGSNRGMVNYEKDLKKKLGKAKKSKGFYKIVIGSNPESVETTDENGNDVTKYFLPVTVKESDVEDLMEPLFELTPKKDYTNSKTIKTAKEDKAEEDGDETKEKEIRKLFSIPGGTATNLAAAYSLSDNTGRLLFGDPQVAMKESGVYGTGSLKLPLPPGSFSVTSHFTNGQLRTDVNTGRSHDGVDLGAPSGTPIYASLPGTVKLAKYNGGFGNCVIIESGDYQIIYGHMSKILCSQGDTVQLGALIGKVGSTGNSTGPHLHFEVRKNGQLIDPEPLLGLN